MRSARIRQGALAVLMGTALGGVAAAQSPPVISDAKGFYNYTGATAPNVDSITAGSYNFSLVITGTGLVPGSVAPGSAIVWIPSGATCPANCIIFDGTQGTTPTIISGNQATVDIPFSLITNTDSGNQVAVANFPYTNLSNWSNRRAFPVNPPLQPAASIPGGTVGVDYSAPLVSGGTPPYSFAYEVGPFPPGLTGGNTGLLAGIPTTAGTYLVDMYAQDVWTSIYSPFTITIAPASGISLTPTTLPGGIVGQPYAQTLTGTGGRAPYLFAVASGSLPAGLSLASNGTIGGLPAAAGGSSFLVRVTDASDASATVPLSISIGPTFTPATLANGQLGQLYSQTLTGGGGTAPYAFSVFSGALPGGLAVSQAGLISGTPTALGTFSFQVEVKDAAQFGSVQPRSIVIGSTPSFTPTTLPNGQVGTAYAQSLTGTSGAAPYTFSVIAGSLPAGVTLSSAGVFSGTPTAAGTANFTVQVRDASQATGSVALALTIAPATSTPSFTPTTVPNGQVGTAYAQSLAGTGGTGPYTFSVIAGNLPAGVSLSSAGAFSGTPTAAGTANFTVQVRDASQATGSAALALTIAPATSAPSFTPATLPNGQVGAAYSQSLTGTGGTAPYTFGVIAGYLPAGVTLSSAGAFSGTPTIAGTAYFTVQVRDAGQATGSIALALTIAPPASGPSFNPITLPNGRVGTAYSQSLTGTNGTAPYTFTVVAGGLPAGLSLSPVGVFSGTPTFAGTVYFSVQVRDATQATGSIAYALTIAPAASGPSFTPTTLFHGQVGTAYSQSLTGTNGTAPYVFSVLAGSLPAGVSLSPAGVFSGTPTIAGTANFIVQVRDGSQATGGVAFALTIAPVTSTLGFTPTTIPSAQVGAAFSQTLTGTGGTAPYTFTLNGGSLPAGLALSTSGTILGVPQQTGTFAVNLLVRDASGAAGFGSLSIVILGSLQILNPALPQATPQQAYIVQLLASGGQPPYVWSVAIGTLPSGLVLNAGAGLISGTPDGQSGSPFILHVRDLLGATATRSFEIPLVVPPPVLLTRELPQGVVGSPYSYTLAATGGLGTLRFAVSSGSFPMGLALSAGGVLTGTPTSAGDYTFVVRVADSRDQFGLGNVRLLINPPALRIVTGALPATQAGAVSIDFAASGGTPPYSWSLGSGTLPPGLSLSSSGVLGGRTDATGGYDFRVVVTDSKKVSASQAFTLQLTVAPLRVSTASLPAGGVGAAYSAGLAAEGGTPPYQWSASGLPAGLELDPVTGAVRGVPTQDGTFRTTARVSDSRGQSASADVTLTIAPPPLSVLPTQLPVATAGLAFAGTFQATGGVPPYNWLVQTGSAPGLVLSSGGVLGGIPTASGAYELTIVVSDARGSTFRRDFTVTVLPRPVTITLDRVPTGVTGQRYSLNLTAQGGNPPYTWTASLPPGLTIDPATGAIGGTPTVAGPSPVSATVRDSAGVTATTSFVVTFALPPLPPLAITGPPDTAEPIRQSQVQLALGTSFPVPVTGVLTLAFRADSGVDDATVQFSTGGRTAPFTIPAGSVDAAFPTPGLGLQNGTVAGVITLTARLLADGVDVTPNPPPTRQIRINAGPPVIATVRATRNATGFDVLVTGYSSTRELTQATFRFTATAGSSLQTGDLALTVDGIFSTWYANPTSVTFGSQFTFTQPFTVQGSSAEIQSVTVTLANRLGASAPATVNLQ